MDVGKRAFTLGLLGAMCVALLVAGIFASGPIAGQEEPPHLPMRAHSGSRHPGPDFGRPEAVGVVPGPGAAAPRGPGGAAGYASSSRPRFSKQDMTLPSVSYTDPSLTADRRVSSPSLPIRLPRHQILPVQRSPYVASLRTSQTAPSFTKPTDAEPKQVLFQATLNADRGGLGSVDVAVDLPNSPDDASFCFHAVSLKGLQWPASSRVGAEAAQSDSVLRRRKRWMRDYYAVCVLGLLRSR